MRLPKEPWDPAKELIVGHRLWNLQLWGPLVYSLLICELMDHCFLTNSIVHGKPEVGGSRGCFCVDRAMILCELLGNPGCSWLAGQGVGMERDKGIKPQACTPPCSDGRRPVLSMSRPRSILRAERRLTHDDVSSLGYVTSRSVSWARFGASVDALLASPPSGLPSKQ